MHEALCALTTDVRDDLRRIRRPRPRDVTSAVDVQPASAVECEGDGLALKVTHIPEVNTLMRVVLVPDLDVEPSVVVAAHEHLVLVRKRVQPVYLGLDGSGGAIIRGIAGENEQIAIRDMGDDSVVGIRDADDPDWQTIPRGLDGRTSQP